MCVYVCVDRSVYLPRCLSIHLPIYLSVYVSMYLSISLWIYTLYRYRNTCTCTHKQVCTPVPTLYALTTVATPTQSLLPWAFPQQLKALTNNLSFMTHLGRNVRSLEVFLCVGAWGPRSLAKPCAGLGAQVSCHVASCGARCQARRFRTNNIARSSVALRLSILYHQKI